MRDIKIMKRYCKFHGLDKATSVSATDKVALEVSLRDDGHTELADYVKNLENHEQLEDLIVNVIYGDM